MEKKCKLTLPILILMKSGMTELICGIPRPIEQFDDHSMIQHEQLLCKKILLDDRLLHHCI